MKNIKTYDPTILLGGAPCMEEYPEGGWVSRTEYEDLQGENRELKRANAKLRELLSANVEGRE